jgi:hypothetical protein
MTLPAFSKKTDNMKQFIIAIGLSIFIAACSNSKTHILAQEAVQLDSLPGECPYLTKDPKGNTVLSWVRLVNDSSSAFCYAVSKDGKTFGSPVVIPNSGNIEPHGENLPKIIFKPSGEIIALWGAANPNPKNKYSGLVFYVQSFDEGKTWTDPRPLIRDTASYDQRYYDVALLSNGEAGIIWLDNRKTISNTGSALYFASTSGKNGFQNEKLIGQPCCPCCRTDLFVDSKGGIHTLYRAIFNDSIRDMVHSVSTDGGKTFSTPKKISNDNWVLNACPHTGPAMTENQNGLHFAWYTGGREPGCYYTQSADNGNNFIKPDSVSAVGSHPQLTSLTDGGLAIVWDETVSENGGVYKKIGLQKRSAAGIGEEKKYLTSETSNASYPVIVALNDQTAFVAYSNKKGNSNFIICRLVSLQ